MRARPVGVGAQCWGCEDRRLSHLRHYEVGQGPSCRWMILCHNCASEADDMRPAPRSPEGLRMRLQRDRRWGDRRAESVGRPSFRASELERRLGDRRCPPKLSDGTMSADDADGPAIECMPQEPGGEIVIEIEADYEEITDDQIIDEPVTGIHFTTALTAEG